MRETNLCPKCGSKDLSDERDAQLQGREFFKIISCNKCKFVELFMPENEEKERKELGCFSLVYGGCWICGSYWCGSFVSDLISSINSSNLIFNKL